MDAVYSESSPRSVAVDCGKPPPPPDPADAALIALGLYLKKRAYRFTTISPASHAKVHARAQSGPPSFEDILGWNRAFRASECDQSDLQRLADAGIVEEIGAFLRSTVRFSTLGQQLFVHTSFPTEQSDAVFFGPDTYRFARFIRLDPRHDQTSRWPRPLEGSGRRCWQRSWRTACGRVCG